jgi:aldehyde:ferredoxin oxidoreductase
MDGFYGRILKVDLDRKNFKMDTIDDAIYEKYLGGKGLASYLLSELNPPGVDPLSPENTLIFTTGPLGGSTVWGSCRYGVYTKAPLTGFFSESYSGGRTPDMIDSTGVDAVVIQGKCAEPAVLTVHPGGVDFHAAGELWGMETYGVEDAINERFAREKYRKKGALVIGPAAENLVRFGCIKNDYWRSAGRTGAGTVMGSKKIKGILFTGNRKRPQADEAAVKAFSKNFMAEFKDHAADNAYRTLGTPMLVKMTNTAGAFPNRYWSKGTMENWENISAEALVEKMDPTPHACGKCFMACGQLGTVKEGRHAGLKIEGPEYETIYAFGGLCLIDSIEEIAYLNDICDRLGMDTISAGNLCAFTIEAARRGKVDYKINYGEVDAIAELLQKMARREGIGEVLSQGIKHAAKEWDLADIAVHVKGLEPAGYDPRTLKGMGLAYATSDRGACHLRATFYKPELAGMIPPDQIEGKAEMFLDFEDRLAIFDTLILCRFYRDFYLWDVLEDVIHSVTGLDAGEKALKEKARAIATQIRRFNLREGMQPEDERLPKALHQALTDTGQVITEDQMEVMLKEYYQLQGWDEAGKPAD